MAKTRKSKPAGKSKSRHAAPVKRARAAAPARGLPKNQPLPGMEDRTIQALEDVGAAYADMRDQRMALTKEEAELKATALNLMIKHDKTIYRSASVLIRRIPGEEDLKVKLLKPGRMRRASKRSTIWIATSRISGARCKPIPRQSHITRMVQ